MKPDIPAIEARWKASTEGTWDDWSGLLWIPGSDGKLVTESGKPSGHDATFCAHAHQDIPALLEYIKEMEHKVKGYAFECNEVEQALGKALGYPWIKADQKNFPGSTEEDGVCVGDHAPGTIAQEAADRIKKLLASVAELEEEIEINAQERRHLDASWAELERQAAGHD